MSKFFDFIGILGKTLEQEARTFAKKGKTDTNWALSTILKFIYFQRERVEKNVISNGKLWLTQGLESSGLKEEDMNLVDLAIQ